MKAFLILIYLIGGGALLYAGYIGSNLDVVLKIMLGSYIFAYGLSLIRKKSNATEFIGVKKDAATDTK